MQALEQLLLQWEHQDVGPMPPEAPSKVREVFADLGSRATADVVTMYAAIGGMEVGDNEIWRLWPLAEVLAENRAVSPWGIFFSDYLLSSWSYRLRPNEDDTSSVYIDHFDGREPTMVTPTLAQFFKLLLENPGRLFGELSESRDA